MAGLFGSSPLAQGTHSGETQEEGVRRLIPARAGNTCLDSESMIAPEAHPRSRGEHGAAVLVEGYEEGSSPLARGTRRSWGGRLRRVRLIPARAGNTAGHRFAAL